MVAFFEENTPVCLRAYHPDYLATFEGARLRGRVLRTIADGREVFAA